MRIAVVLPTLNEGPVLEHSLRSLANQTRLPDRVVVVDGGSTDDTVRQAARLGAEVRQIAGRGRGGQIAAGVAECREDVVVVAHADMVFSPNAISAIESYLLKHPVCPGGCLGHRFDHSKWSFRAIEWWDRRRARRGYSYGDQCQFFRREVLEGVGGFPDLPLMEDVELARRLRRLGRVAYLDLPVTVLARRYEQLGWPRVMWQNWCLRRTYDRFGPAKCWMLYRRYYHRNELKSTVNN